MPLIFFGNSFAFFFFFNFAKNDWRTENMGIGSGFNFVQFYET